MTDNTSFTISEDDNMFDGFYQITPAVRDQMEDAFYLAMGGKKSSIKKLQRIITKFPRIPHFKNYLSVLYDKLGQIQNASKVTEQIVVQHPEYFFGKSNLAMLQFQEGKIDEMPLLLGEQFDLKEMYPDRDVFHIDEVVKMKYAAVYYFSSQGDFERAEEELKLIEEIAPESDSYRTASLQLMKSTFSKSMERISELKEAEVGVEENEFVVPQKVTPPVLTHKEVEQLYHFGFSLDENVVQEVLSLPRTTLIQDLELVIQDAISRFRYFENGEGTEEEVAFLFHSFFLLSELQATESITTIIYFMSQPDNVVSFYLGDTLTTYCWQVFYYLENGNLQAYQAFMRSPGLYTFAKVEVATAVSQIALHQPDRRNEIIDWFYDILTFFNKSELNDNVIDSELLGLITSDVLDFKGEELLPLIEELYTKGYIGLGVCGDFDDVCEGIESVNMEDEKRVLLSLKEIGLEISSWSHEESIEEEELPNIPFSNSFPSQNNTPKIGRNEPCSCGSGKKYKKCCGK